MVETVTTVLAIPGSWPSPPGPFIMGEYDGFQFVGTMVIQPDTKEMYNLKLQEQDPQIQHAFRNAGQRSLQEADLTAIGLHTHVQYLLGTGGSMEAAQTLMRIAAVLLSHGGIAVKVETAGVAFSARDWRNLTAQREEPYALYRAFVALVGGPGECYSCGMHNLGLPDGVLSARTDLNEAAQTLETFLLYTLAERPDLYDGHTFSTSAQAPRYRLRREPCTRYGPDDLFFNPFGVWHLTNQR